MRKLLVVATVLMSVMLILTPSCTQEASAPTTGKPTVVVIPAVVPLAAETQIVIMGSDYIPGQKIKILVREPQAGSTVNMASQVDPTPIPNDQGCWATTWTLGRYASRGVYTEGVYFIHVTDENLNSLASAPIGLVDITKPRHQWPTWAQVVVTK